ncbi:Uncharacterized protein Fot_17074 [Forsythia ovata]|uniref:Uncharacterized protein n=1 Tax=Forsythia ovata TaxID=205694 RepID=A0ABD1VGF3_9LAMI
MTIFMLGRTIFCSTTCLFVKGKVSKVKSLHLCQRPLDQTGCKSKDVHEWQGLEGESQQANFQDRSPQYFSENLPHTRIERALSEDFSPRYLKPYQLAHAPGANNLPLLLSETLVTLSNLDYRLNLG